MTATDELRRLLDERGVEWMDDSYAQLWCTVWHGQDGKQWRMTENQSGMLTELKAWKVTPAQAIAATLGAGTCKEVYLLMATDIGNGREEVLGAYATESAATKAISENQFGYAFHHVRKLEVTS